jgi:predicted nuclease of predicted toxin-antitoxin system
VQPPLYLDEDSSQRRLIVALRNGGIDVLTAVEAGLSGATDAEHLKFATESGRAIVTANRGDFARLHSEWASIGRAHGGIIIRSRQGTPPEVLATAILAALQGRTQADIANGILFV